MLIQEVKLLAHHPSYINDGRSLSRYSFAIKRRRVCRAMTSVSLERFRGIQ
jgi:hypothetical protein